MIVQHIIRPVLRLQGGFPFQHRLEEAPGPPGAVGEGEIEGRVQPFRPHIGRGLLHGVLECLAHSIALTVAVQNRPDFFDQRLHLGLRVVVAVVLAVPADQADFGRVGGQIFVFEVGVEHVQAEAVHTHVQPEAEHIQHGGADLRIAPVQVRLLRVEHVEVVLPGGGVKLPAAAAEARLPVVGRAAVRGRIAPEVPVPVRIVPGFARFLEPAVLVRGVVEHQVEDYADAAPVGFIQQALKVLHGAKAGIDGVVVGHIVAKVGVRCGEDGRKPDGVHAQVLQVIQLPADSVQIADAVAIGVGKRARVDLVDDAVTPPQEGIRHARTS